MGRKYRRLCVLTASLALLAGGCATQPSRATSSVYAYLYPDKEAKKVEPGQAVLTLPVKVGIAFVPSSGGRGGGNFWSGYQRPASLDPVARRQLLDKVAARFKDNDAIGHIEIIPTDYLTPGGGFENLSQIGRMYDVDIMALVSYDQVQTTDEGAASLSYWTLVGAYVIPGEKNTTTTLMDTAVFDIKSHRLLFRAPGTSQVKGSSTPVNLSEELRVDSQQGFAQATDKMIINLAAELDRFKERIKTNSSGVKVVQSGSYHGGGGSGGLLLLVALGGLCLRRRHAGAG